MRGEIRTNSKRIHGRSDAHGTQFREVIRYFEFPFSDDKRGIRRQAALRDRDIIESNDTCFLETLNIPPAAMDEEQTMSE